MTETLPSLTKEKTGFFCICEGLFWRPHFRLCRRDLNFWPWSLMHKRDLNLACTKETLLSHVQTRHCSFLYLFYKRDITLACTKETLLYKRNITRFYNVDLALEKENSFFHAQKSPESRIYKREITLTCTNKTLLFFVPLLQKRHYSLWKKKPHSCIHKRNLNLWCEKETLIFNIQKRYESMVWHATCSTLQHTATHCNTLQQWINTLPEKWQPCAAKPCITHTCHILRNNASRSSESSTSSFARCTSPVCVLNECIRVWVFVCVNVYVCM